MATSKSSQDNFFVNWANALSARRIRTLRLISQIIMFVIINGVIIGLSRIPFPAPIAMPAGAPFGIVWGGIDAIQYMLAIGQFPFFVFGLFFITGATVGKFFCGWACPVGFWQDMLSWFPTKKWKISKPDNKAFQEISGFILWFILLFTAWVGYQTTKGDVAVNYWTRMPYAVIDPAGTMMVTLFYAFFWDILPGDAPDEAFGSIVDSMGFIFILKMLVLLIISLISMKVPRAYCRWICPTGALLGYVSSNSILTVKRDPIKCVDGCNACEAACPMGVPLLDEDPSGISNSLCINCGNCIDACPDAMSFGFRL
ncbi:MAG: 4Fe-4S binding protein [Candidatus Kariarchaeaceae archaeon]|jgi:polyferredoxin